MHKNNHLLRDIQNNNYIEENKYILGINVQGVQTIQYR